MYVVVTRADNGVQHVYGPFLTRSGGQTMRRRLLATAQHEGYGLDVSVHRVLECGP